jgi:glycerophosphoryl diester phosphodiesterase
LITQIGTFTAYFKRKIAGAMKNKLLVGLCLFTFTRLQAQFDIQGHRGCRGHLPENSIPAMLYAITLGATTLELDVVVSSDLKVVVSHEPWMAYNLCLKPDGSSVSKQEARMLNLFQMTYDSIRSYTCGTIAHASFPNQKPLSVYKPTLTELIDSVENYVRENKLTPVKYNIEIKSQPEWDGFYQPEPLHYCQLVLAAIRSKLPLSSVIVQSFDYRILDHMKALSPELTLAFLVDDPGDGSIESYLSRLLFKPPILSPHYSLLSEEFIQRARDLGIKVVPWTINDIKDMERVIRMGVDGIISDYPDRIVQALQNLEKDR